MGLHYILLLHAHILYFCIFSYQDIFSNFINFIIFFVSKMLLENHSLILVSFLIPLKYTQFLIRSFFSYFYNTIFQEILLFYFYVHLIHILRHFSFFTYFFNHTIFFLELLFFFILQKIILHILYSQIHTHLWVIKDPIR